jgi:hypothetical protein
VVGLEDGPSQQSMRSISSLLLLSTGQLQVKERLSPSGVRLFLPSVSSVTYVG